MVFFCIIIIISRPGSLRHIGLDGQSDTESTDDEESTSNMEDDTRSQGDYGEDHDFRDKSDTRSIRSFSSMMSPDRHREGERDRDLALMAVEEKKERASLTDRLANMPALAPLARLAVSVSVE
jgi:hypothetical protein